MLDNRLEDPSAYGTQLRGWLADNRARLSGAIQRAEGGDANAELRLLKEFAAADMTQVGWPHSVGGVGGGAIHRAVFYHCLATEGYPIPHVSYVFETVAPALIEFGNEEHRARVAAHIRGEEIWCQGFSEPDAGSDLGAVRLRATREGDSWLLTGEKLWVSLGHLATWCLLLARTGTVEERHRGLSMFFVPMAGAGIQARQLDLLTGRGELASLTLDAGRVGSDALVGTVGGGWQVAMFLLQWERAMYAWQRSCWLGARLRELLQAEDTCAHRELGSLATHLAALRCRSLETIRGLDRGERVGPATSIDKMILTNVERGLFDLARRLLSLELGTADDAIRQCWRADYFYSRMASVYGGTEEIQLDTIAHRVLGLPGEPRSARG